MQRLRRFIRFLVNEIDATDADIPGPAMAELEEAMMVFFLLGSRSSFSPLLERLSPAAAPWQVRRVEQYIEAHWDQPITMEALARESTASVRSIFHAFKQCRGYSPMAFLKQVRLQNARRMLSRADVVTSVLEVAVTSGFSNPGHFAKDYFERYGERPSETLRGAKSGARAKPGKTIAAP
jgi:transcriptional regulator GlxA family with amidase domain